MEIQTGRGNIPLITLVGIWSISALNALPGLAVSPILGQLSVIFPDATELEIQMVSSLPSLLIIPFIILSGQLTERVNSIKLLQIGLSIFLLSGILYLLSNKMWQLVVVSGLLGIGSGLIVPLSTGLISHFFTGPYRTKQFGYSSAITNVTLVLATVLTGYLAEENWHLPFLVYLFPIVSIFLSFYLKKNIESKSSVSDASDISLSESNMNSSFGRLGIQIKRLIGIMLFYGLSTYLVIIISFNLPFLMKEYGFSSGISGIMISLFFLAIMAPGLILNKIIERLGNLTEFCSMLSIAVGILLILIFRTEWLIGLGCILAGLGYGVIQPIAYDKTTRTAIPQKVTLALAFVMSMNYLAILLCPFIIDAIKDILNIETQQFAFIFNMIIAVITALFTYLKRNTFLFRDIYGK